MPTSIEQSCVEQGYVLPDGLSWEMVVERRELRRIPEIYVPVAFAPGCVGWGVPFVDGALLRHPSSDVAR